MVAPTNFKLGLAKTMYAALSIILNFFFFWTPHFVSQTEKLNVVSATALKRYSLARTVRAITEMLHSMPELALELTSEGSLPK